MYFSRVRHQNHVPTPIVAKLWPNPQIKLWESRCTPKHQPIAKKIWVLMFLPECNTVTLGRSCLKKVEGSWCTLTGVLQVSGEIHLGQQYHFYMETQIARAETTEEGGFKLECATQTQTWVQNAISYAFGTPNSRWGLLRLDLARGFTCFSLKRIFVNQLHKSWTSKNTRRLFKVVQQSL